MIRWLTEGMSHGQRFTYVLGLTVGFLLGTAFGITTMIVGAALR